MTNNTMAAAMCIVLGVLLGVPVLYVLWQNVRDTSPNHFLREAAEREMDLIARALAG